MNEYFFAENLLRMRFTKKNILIQKQIYIFKQQLSGIKGDKENKRKKQ